MHVLCVFFLINLYIHIPVLTCLFPLYVCVLLNIILRIDNVYCLSFYFLVEDIQGFFMHSHFHWEEVTH